MIDTSINLLFTTDVMAYIEGSTTGSSSSASLYDQVINTVSAQFNMWTERTLTLNSYPTTVGSTVSFPDFDDYDGNGTAILYTRQAPISTTGVVIYIDSDYQWTTDTIVATSDIKISYREGRLFLYQEIFKVGYNDVRIYYAAGYNNSSSAYNIPADLKRAALEMCQWWWMREMKADRIGTRSESFEGGSRTFETDMPWSVKQVLEHYRYPSYG